MAETSNEKQADILKAFEEYDRDKNGFISLLEAQSVMRKKFGFPPEQTRKIMHMCDKNNDGQLSYTEFVVFYGKVKEKMSEIKAIFNQFDSNHDGYVTMEEAKQSMTRMGFNPIEVEGLVTIHDVNKDGRLEYDEFIKFWMSK